MISLEIKKKTVMSNALKDVGSSVLRTLQTAGVSEMDAKQKLGHRSKKFPVNAVASGAGLIGLRCRGGSLEPTVGNGNVVAYRRAVKFDD